MALKQAENWINNTVQPQLDRAAKSAGLTKEKGSEDPIAQPTLSKLKALLNHTKDYKATLQRTLSALEELNAANDKVAMLTRDFFQADDIDPEHPIQKAMLDYDAVMKEMTYDVPKRMKALVEDEIMQPCETWHGKIFDMWRGSKDMENARQTYDHYVEKMEQMEMDRVKRVDKGKAESADQIEKNTRNQGKLQNAEETYMDFRDKWCEECDDILLPRKSDFLKLALRTVQFQQTLYTSTAKKAQALSGVIEAMQDTLEKGEGQWEENDFATHKKEIEADGGDPNRARKKALDKNSRNGRGGRSSRNRGGSDSEDGEDDSKELAAFKRKAGQVESELRYMDEDQFQGAMERLESRMQDADRSDRKAMKAKLRELDDAWKSKGGSKVKGGRGRSGSGKAGGGGGEVDISHVPPEHVATLRKDPSLAPEFDKIYGPGASEAILAGGRDRNNSGAAKSGKKPKAEHVDMLLKDPSLAPKFEQIYGPGSADELLRKTGNQVRDDIPPEHVEKLKQNPGLASEFDRIYGPGTSASILGTGEEDDVLELCTDGYEAPAAPDVPMVNGKEVQQAHIDMLLGDPSLGDKFDQFYGPGGAQQVLAHYGQGAPQNDDDMLNLMANQMGQGAQQQQQRDQAKADAVDQYKAMREAASPRNAAPRKEPSEKHIQMLRDNPSFAPKFDAVYGEGASDSILGGDAAITDMQDTYREGPMFPDSGAAKPLSVSPLDMSKIGGGGGGGDDAENSNSPRTNKWRKENETRAAMGLKPKPHPSKKKK